MNERYISISKINAIRASFGTHDSKALAVAINVEMAVLGYTMDKALFAIVSTMEPSKLETMRAEIIDALCKLTGNDVKYVAMYPGFPEEVMSKSTCELYFNAFIHYLTLGEWLPPKDETLTRRHRGMLDREKLNLVGVATDSEFYEIFDSIAASRDSISDGDKQILSWFISTDNVRKFPDEIPFRENAAVIAGELLKSGKDVSPMFASGANDVLRIASYLSGGDITLTENTKFKSFSRPVRKQLVRLINNVDSIDDMIRHRERWVRLFHTLHVNEHRRYKNAVAIATMLRSKSMPKSFASIVETAIDNKDWTRAAAFLQNKPGDYVRRFDKIARGNPEIAIAGLSGIIDKVPTRVLASAYGYVKSRKSDAGPRSRMVMPKGNKSYPLILPEREKIDTGIMDVAGSIMTDAFLRRFKSQPSLGRVWIDSNLFECPLPTQMRSASGGKLSAARGTKFSMEDAEKGTIRLFIYWVGLDIDLGATFHGEDFKMLEQVSWTNLKSGKCYHSGDIVRAPKGASEFIDVDIDWALKSGFRYVAMSVRVFNGPTFDQHEKCYAGWMMRKSPASGEIYDPATVVQRVDLTQESTAMVPVAFDLLERKAIWTDVSGSSHDRYYGNSIESNRGSMIDSLRYALSMSNRKMTIGELLQMHAMARGEIVKDREDADVAFGPELALDVTRVNSEFVV